MELPGARLLHALRLTPNAVTLLGFAVCAVASFLVGSGWLLAGGIVFLAGSGLDLMDGALARLTGTVRPFGALLDSVFDRLGEAAMFLGLAIYGLRAGFSEDYRLFFITVVFLALIFSQGVSYLRARGEGLGVFTRAGHYDPAGAGGPAGNRPYHRSNRLVRTGHRRRLLLHLFQRMFTIGAELNKGG